MPYKKLIDDEVLEIGDLITHQHAFGKNTWEVFKVTPKFAFVHYNERALGKYPRTFSFRFSSLPRIKWDTTDYTVYRKI